MIWTGTFDNYEKYMEADLFPVCMETNGPCYFEGLEWLNVAPPLMLNLKYINGEITQEQYNKMYQEYLLSVDIEMVKEFIERIPEPILLWYEKSPRDIVITWLNSLGYETKSYEI